jgi:hypothetical protein
MICLSYHYTVILQKIRFVFFFWQKRPKTIVIGIIVQDDKNSNKPASIHMTFYVNPSWACTLFRNNKQHVRRESVNVVKKADFDGFREKEE